MGNMHETFCPCPDMSKDNILNLIFDEISIKNDLLCVKIKATTRYAEGLNEKFCSLLFEKESALDGLFPKEHFQTVG